MKIALLLAANVALVGAGLITYDVIKGTPQTSDESGLVADLNGRLDDLEDRLGSMDTNGGERRLESRLVQLERRVAGLESAKPAALANSADVADAAPVTELVAAAPDAEAIVRALENDEEALAAVAQKLAAARERDRSADMVNRMTDRLGLSLTEAERKQVADTLSTWRDSMRERMMSARADGVPREEMRPILEEARGELTDSLAEFLSVQDAEAIAATVGPGGGGRGRGGFGGGR